MEHGALVLFRGMFTPSPFLYNIGLEAVLFVVYVKIEKGSVVPFYDMKIFYENILQQIVPLFLHLWDKHVVLYSFVFSVYVLKCMAFSKNVCQRIPN